MKRIMLFEEFINELEFKDANAFKVYAKDKKIGKNTKVTIAGKTFKGSDLMKDDEKEDLKDPNDIKEKEFIAYHTSGTALDSFKSGPMWFTKVLKYAKAYHSNAIEEGRDAHTYQIKIKGNFLSVSEADAWANEAGIDHEETVTELTSQPDSKAIMKLIKPYSKICDGFDHWDYDPIDWGDAESTLVFDASKSATILKEMKF